jgi:hypothetical protein
MTDIPHRQYPRLQPNLNGTDQGELQALFRSAARQADDLQDTMAAIRTNALHLRNYQTVDGAKHVATEDRDNCIFYQQVLSSLQLWLEAGKRQVD